MGPSFVGVSFCTQPLLEEGGKEGYPSEVRIFAGQQYAVYRGENKWPAARREFFFWGGQERGGRPGGSVEKSNKIKNKKIKKIKNGGYSSSAEEKVCVARMRLSGPLLGAKIFLGWAGKGGSAGGVR